MVPEIQTAMLGIEFVLSRAAGVCRINCLIVLGRMVEGSNGLSRMVVFHLLEAGPRLVEVEGPVRGAHLARARACRSCTSGRRHVYDIGLVSRHIPKKEHD